MSSKRFLRTSLAAGVVCLAVGLPIALACVIPRTLPEQMELAGDEVIWGRVQSFEEIWIPDAIDGRALWTLVHFRAEESFVTGRKGFDVEFVFRGGVLPGSPTTSITPSPEDIRPGRTLLLFLADRELGRAVFGDGVLHLDSYAECYPVVEWRHPEDGTRRVVLGKGQGFAFPDNVELDGAREAVAAILKARRENR